MVANVKILTARRSFEFAPDDLRLTLLSTRLVFDYLKELLAFQNGTIATPMDTFGSVPPTIPPGLVFNYGAIPAEEGDPVPVRLLHFEPRRIVLDVAGPSSVLGPTLDLIRTKLQDLRAPDGSPAIGEPIGTRDYSEVTVEFPFPSTTLLHPAIRDAFDGVTAVDNRDLGFEELPFTVSVGIVAQRVPNSREFPGNARGEPFAVSIEPRAGAPLSDRVFFSSAPLDTDAHIAHLERIEAAVLQGT